MTRNDHAPPQGTGPIQSIDPPGRKATFTAIMALVAIEPVIIVVVLLAVGAPWWIVACVLGFGMALVAGIFLLINFAVWRPWQRQYPAQPILPGAVSQSWQTFGLGRFTRLSNCLTIIADERHLHLIAFAPMRWLGAARISLPLDRMHDVRAAGFPRFQMTAKLDDREIFGPGWCLKLATPEEPGIP